MAVDLLAGERQRGETDKATTACNDYLRQGPGRSLAKLRDQYNRRRVGEAGVDLPPTTRITTLEGWSARYGWSARAGEYDAQIEAIKTERARRIMETGLATAPGRVQKLKWLAAYLEAQINEEDAYGRRPNVWLEDVKQVGSGKTAERVDLVRFNNPLIEQYRSTLSDLAAETGGRPKPGSTPDNPSHIVTESRDEWERRAAARAAAAGATLAEFDEPEPDGTE